MNWSWVIWMIVTALGVFDLYLIITRTRKLNAKRAWPETDGIISKGRIDEINDNEGRTSRFVLFTFTYQVSGAELQGRFSIGRIGILSLSKAESAIAEHPVGSHIPVRYNPQRPHEYFTKYDESDISNYVMRLWIYFALLMIPFSWTLSGLLRELIK